MSPFEITNREGLSNAYTDNMYQFAPRPTCSHQNPNCGSAYLFCDTRPASAHCVAKVKPNGNCAGFEGLDACVSGVCQGQFCRSGGFAPTPAPWTAPSPTQAPVTQASTAQPMGQNSGQFFAQTFQNVAQQPSVAQVSSLLASATRPSANCFNEDPCCSAWARKGECMRNVAYMGLYCRRSCQLCRGDNRRGCVDRHPACPYWRSRGECFLRRQWMAENCRQSCGWCHLSDSQICTSLDPRLGR
ncbi:Protein TYR-1 [Aphelenchoides avenae]|nr:Protein TYR-1 [Aphelenchus avenae]